MMRRRWYRFALVALALLVTLVVAIVIVVSTPWFRRQVRDFAVREINAQLNGELEIGSITGSLLHDVTLHDVILRQQGEPVIRVASVRARFDAFSLVRGRYDISELIVDHPSLRAVQQTQGWNLASLFEPRPQTTDRQLVFHIFGLKVIDGRVRIEPLGRPATALESVDLEGGLTYDDNGLAIDVAKGDLDDHSSGLSISQLVGRAVFGDEGTRVTNLTVVLPGVRVTGALDLPADRRNQAIDAEVELADAAPTAFNFYLPQPAPAGIMISGRVTARGQLQDLAATWALQSNAGATDGEMHVNALAAPLTGRGQVSVTTLDVAAWTGRHDIGGPFTARATFDGALDTTAPARSRVAFTISSGPALVAGYRLTSLEGRGRLADARLQASGRVVAYRANATFNATATGLDRAGMPPLRATGTLHHLNLQALPPSTKAPMLVTDISGDYALDVTRSDWAAHLVADESTVEDAQVHAGAVLQAESHRQSLTASVDAAVSNVSATLLRLPKSSRATLLNGGVHATILIPDLSQPITPDRVVGSALVELTGSTVQGAAVDRASLDASMDYGLLDVRAFDLASPALSAHAKGQVAFEGAEADSDLTYTIDAPDLSALASLGVESLRGGAHLEGTVTGPAGQLEATGTFATQQLGYADSVEALAFNGKYTARVPDLDFKQVSAAIDGESTFLTVKGEEIQRLVLSGDYHDTALNLQARIEQKTRTVDVAGGALLHPDHREIHVREFALGGVGEPWRLQGPEATIDYRDNSATVSTLVLARGDERIDAEGRLVFAGDGGGSDFSLTTTGLQVGDVYTLLTGTPTVTGTADAEVHMTGTLEAPAATGTLVVTDGSVMDARFSRASGDVALAHRRATVDARVEEAAGSALVVKGTAPIAKDAGDFDLTVNSDEINLGLMQAFTTQVQQVAGTASLDLDVTGPLDAPVVAGNVAVANGGFLVPATGVKYQNLTADIGFDGRRANIRQLSIADDDGHQLQATGGADVLADNGTRQVDIVVKTDAIHVVEGDLGDVEVSADARVRGTVAAPEVTGQIAVNRGRIEIDEVLRQLIPPSSAPAEAAAQDPSLDAALAQPAASSTPAVAPPAPSDEHEQPTPAGGVFANAVLHVDVLMPDDVVLRGRNIRTSAGGMGLGDMNLTVGGKLELRKEAGQTPVIVGAVEVVRGFYEFQGRRFDVTRGSELRFRGVQPVNPSLNVTGEREVSGVTARVHVTGTARQPALELSSTPPLDEGDVLSLIVFNQPVNELGEGEQVTLMQRAGDLAAGMLATSLSDSLGRALDVDLFEIKAPSSGEAGEVSVGNQINERLFVAFRQQFGASEGSQLSLEYRLTEALRLLTTVGQGGTRTGANRTEAAGVDIVYLIRY